jgi:hypothetical protein
MNEAMKRTLKDIAMFIITGSILIIPIVISIKCNNVVPFIIELVIIVIIGMLIGISKIYEKHSRDIEREREIEHINEISNERIKEQQRLRIAKADIEKIMKYQKVGDYPNFKAKGDKLKEELNFFIYIKLNDTVKERIKAIVYEYLNSINLWYKPEEIQLDAKYEENKMDITGLNEQTRLLIDLIGFGNPIKEEIHVTLTEEEMKMSKSYQRKHEDGHIIDNIPNYFGPDDVCTIVENRLRMEHWWTISI